MVLLCVNSYPKRFIDPSDDEMGWEVFRLSFFVRGERGVRLSNALEKKWAGFEGRDDTFLFEDGRIQIMLRLLVSLPSIASYRRIWLVGTLSKIS